VKLVKIEVTGPVNAMSRQTGVIPLENLVPLTSALPILNATDRSNVSNFATVENRTEEAAQMPMNMWEPKERRD
jgi:hypothetical protein